MKKGIFTYENGIVALMALTFGSLFFDRLALNFLMPYVSKDLALSNTQIGLLAGGLSLAWAISSFITTAWAERKDKKKLVFILAVFTFSICSFGSGIAQTFGMLLLARIIMGIAEGPIIPLAQNFVERASSSHRLGLNSGMLQAFGAALFGSILAPVLLVKLADNMGWRNAFFIAGVPGFILGIIAWFFIRRSTSESRPNGEDTGWSLKELWAYNNVRWGLVVASCTMGWWFATLPFISNYFVNVQGMTNDEMSKTMGLLGVAGLLSSIIVPGLSDKIGRKKTILIFSVIGIFYPLAVKFLAGSSLHLPAMLLTYFMMGLLPVVAAVIPSEATPDHLKAKAIGLVTCVGEIFGGVLIPTFAGFLSDSTDPSAFLWISAAMAALTAIFSFRLD